MNHSFRGKVAVVLGASAAAGTGWAMAKALWGAAARSSLARGACRSLSHWLVPLEQSRLTRKPFLR